MLYTTFNFMSRLLEYIIAWSLLPHKFSKANPIDQVNNFLYQILRPFRSPSLTCKVSLLKNVLLLYPIENYSLTLNHHIVPLISEEYLRDLINVNHEATLRNTLKYKKVEGKWVHPDDLVKKGQRTSALRQASTFGFDIGY